jgi:hypothetical protein
MKNRRVVPMFSRRHRAVSRHVGQRDTPAKGEGAVLYDLSRSSETDGAALR